MRAVISLFLLTLVIPILNILVLLYGITNNIVFLYYGTLLLIFGVYYKNKPHLSLKFDLLFFKCLVCSLFFVFILVVVVENKHSLAIPNNISAINLALFFVLPFLEEFFFRYYLFIRLEKLKASKIMIISSLLFTFSHVVYPSGLLYIFIFSLGLSYYYYKSKNLLMVYLMHLSINLLLIL